MKKTFFTLTLFLGVFAFAGNAFAGSITITHQDDGFSTEFQVSLNKTTYSPGEAITASASVFTGFCFPAQDIEGSFAPETINLTAGVVGGDSASFDSVTIPPDSGSLGSVTLAAPQTEGSHSANFTGSILCGGNNSKTGDTGQGATNISFTVLAPEIDPPTIDIIPESQKVGPGDPAKLDWIAENDADGVCEASGAWGGRKLCTHGEWQTETVTASESTGSNTYTLTAENAAGTKALAVDSVEVIVEDTGGDDPAPDPGDEPPTAIIELPSSNVSISTGDTVLFQGLGTDDQSVVLHEWRQNSCTSGSLLYSQTTSGSSNSSSFSKTFTSAGSFTIYFRVQDNVGAWSSCDSVSVTVSDPDDPAPPPEDPDPGDGDDPDPGDGGDPDPGDGGDPDPGDGDDGGSFSLQDSGDIEVDLTGGQAQQSTATNVTVSPSGDFASDVSLSVSQVSPALPGAIFNFGDSTLSSDEYSSGSSFSVTVPGDTLGAFYTIVIQGDGGGLVRTTSVILEVISNRPKFEEF